MSKLTATAALLAILAVVVFSQQSDALLRSVIEKDRASRGSGGKLITLTAAEHLSRGSTYFENRQFPEAREHLQKILDLYPSDAGVSSALFMIGRSYMWEREYARAIPFFDRASREFPSTKDGREGLNFKGACHVRLGNHSEAAKYYEQYTVMYPTGERIDGAFLNLIDALREAERYDEAVAWVDRARQRFSGTPTEVNALHARLRMEIHRGLWANAETTADTIISLNDFSGAMTGGDEIRYLKAFAMEKAGKRALATAVYSSISAGSTSYYSGLAGDRLTEIGSRTKRILRSAAVKAVDFPIVFRSEVLQYTRKKKLDPRFVLAIMKQESGFNPTVKSPSAARGLLQLVFDTALKYNEKAGFNTLQPDDLYQPRINIAVGCEYLAALRDEFGGLNEAIAASYNGGEDNAARWLNRSKPKDAGIFTSEIGFAETKNYVFKVMTNYRIYSDLYDENLTRK